MSSRAPNPPPSSSRPANAARHSALVPTNPLLLACSFLALSLTVLLNVSTLSVLVEEPAVRPALPNAQLRQHSPSPSPPSSVRPNVSDSFARSAGDHTASLAESLAWFADHPLSSPAVDPRMRAGTRNSRGILFVKIPKVGGTTVAELLQLHAKRSAMRLAVPVDGSLSVHTCDGTQDEKLAAWKAMVVRNGRKLEIFASHACLHAFMMDRKYWLHNRQPLLITLLRDPWAQFVSKFRYTRFCCETGHWEWCSGFCVSNSVSIVKFEHVACNYNAATRCNTQKKYLVSLVGPGDLDDLVRRFGLILIVERLEASLVLLHFMFGIPLSSMVHMRSNANQALPFADIPHGFREMVIKEDIEHDLRLYRKASARLDWHIARLPEPLKSAFPVAVRQLTLMNAIAHNTCGKACTGFRPLTAEKLDCERACLERVQDLAANGTLFAAPEL